MSDAPRRRLLVLLAGLFALALGLRLLYLHQMADAPLWDRPILDEAYNDAWAARLAQGLGSPQVPYFRAPLYPWLVGLTYRLAGRAPGHVRLAQALLSALTCLGVALLARDLYGDGAGFGAGLLAAAYWPWIYFDGELQDVPLTLFLDVGALLLLLRTDRSGPRGLLAALGGGVTLGLSAIARPTILIIIPAVLAWMVAPARGVAPSPRRRVGLAGVLLAGLALPVLPVAGVNHTAGGDRVLIASQGGLNFYIGNNADSDGHSARLPGASAEWEGMLEESRRRAEAAEGRSLLPSEISRHWSREGLRFWAESPGAALRLTARKAAFLLGAPELPNNKQILFFTGYAPMMRAPWPDLGLVAPLALVGLIWGGTGRRAALVAAVAASYGLAVIAFFVAARFRMPFAALLIVPAGGGIQALWRRRRAGGRLAAPLVVLALAALAVNLPRLGYRENTAHAHYTLGNAYRARGELAAAVEEFGRAAALDPAFREARRNLGGTLLEAGRAPEAVERLTPEVRRDPGDLESRFNLALALQAVGRPDEAVEQLEGAAREHPASPEILVRLGNLRAAAGRHAEAAADFRSALAVDPESSAARFNLGNEHLALGRLEEAATEYRRLLSRHPDHTGAWSNLGVTLARRGQPAEAAEALRRGLRLEPGGHQMRIDLAQILIAAGAERDARAELERVLAEAQPGGEFQRRARALLRALSEP